MSLELPNVVCTCNLEGRQAAADAEAQVKCHDLVRLWHTSRCDIVLRMDLRKTIEKITELEATPMLPDPVLDRMRAEELAELIATRDLLWHRLEDTTGAKPPTGDWYQGASQLTGLSHPRRALGAQRKAN